MKVLLIYPDILGHHRDWTGYFYMGLASIAATLKLAGHSPTLLHITRKALRQDEFLERVNREGPDLIGFSSTSHMFSLVTEMAGWLADCRIKVPVICGGIHATIAPEEVIATRGITLVCRGEGEEPLVELCDQLSRGRAVDAIHNLWLRKGDEVIRNPVRQPRTNLDELPYPDRSLFDYPTLYFERRGTAVVMASRGCPYDCSYCCNHLLREVNGGKAVRFRGVENLLGEMRRIIRQYPFVRRFHFDDDILFLDRRWAAEFASRYPAEIGFPFECNGRADITDEHMVALMKKAGCRLVKIGVESGNERISNDILNRRLSNAQIRKAFAACKAAGIGRESFNMLGVPTDTVHTMLDTIKLNAEIAPDQTSATIFQPYYGTRLAKLCQEQHLAAGHRINADVFSGSNLDLPGATRAQILMLRDYFKILIVMYWMLGRLPAGLNRRLVALADSILSWRATARFLNFLHVPLEALRQLILVAIMKVHLFRQKRFATACPPPPAASGACAGVGNQLA